MLIEDSGGIDGSMNGEKAIVTVVNGEKFEEIWKRSESFFVDYSERCDADLIVLKNTQGLNLPSPHWIKFGIYDLLKKEFDRVAFIDADVIIRPDAPSLFDVVPEDQFGIFNEGEFTPRAVCIHEVRKVFKVDLKLWNGVDYYNTGVFVCSRKHRFIFKVEEEIKPLRNAFGEQTYLNMRILANPQVKVFPLNYKFNRLSIMDRVLGMTRLDSYIIHYAGDGDNLLPKMDRDIERWKQDAPEYKYKRKIFIWSMGGLGDCIASEPVIRYIKKKVYQNDDVFLMSLYKDLYTHLPVNLAKDASEFNKDNEFDAVHEMNTHQTPWSQFGQLVPFSYVHSIDWASMSTIGRALPDKDKQIILTYTPENVSESLRLTDRLDDLILVHPGVGWAMKTFPVEWWQKVVDDLDSLGFRVGLIGKHMNEQHGVLEIKCPPNGVDFRNQHTIHGLIALIAKARMLVTNDSAPLWMAGAFDNYIVLIPTCKHPDLILPWRNCDKYYKAAAVCKKIREDDDFPVQTDLRGWVMKDIPEGHTIEEYIPAPEEVVDKVIDFNDQWEKSHCSTKGEENEDGKGFVECEGSGLDIVEPYKRRLRHEVCGEVFHAGRGAEDRPYQ
jgi:lipopolysaccharide biosynthesis glycosyltransferase